ncbi:hypothetical protein EMPS_09334 [Entomortierella parvispora]|uniref:Uncharacterized protein n=1 Tax=Entomortierella parvispora TaxID=205924 RepID=A0A9P3M0H7_9FUNG|nr:hypothetical protein EMPS_09334 [Entomortierella parvispora]
MAASVHSSSDHCADMDQAMEAECNVNSNNYDLLLSTLSASSSCSNLSEYQDSPQLSRRRKTAYMTTTIITTTTTTTTTTSAPSSPVTSSNAQGHRGSISSNYSSDSTSDHGPTPRSPGGSRQGGDPIFQAHASQHQEQRHQDDVSLLPGLRLVSEGPYLFLFDVTISLYYPIRALILFVLGFAFSLVIDHLQTQHHLIEYPSNIPQLWDTASWLPPTCGASAVLIGTIYPLGDYLWWGKRIDRNGNDWSSVMRCLGGFIGVNYAASKLPWTSSLQVSCTLALISVGLWFWFDRTVHGFVISLLVASMGTLVAYFLVLNGWYSFTRADFFGVGSWIPCILYSSSVCFGSIGRQLDVVPEAWYQQDTTQMHLKTE